MMMTTQAHVHNSVLLDDIEQSGRAPESPARCKSENCFTFSFAKKIIIRSSSSGNNNNNKNTVGIALLALSLYSLCVD